MNRIGLENAWQEEVRTMKLGLVPRFHRVNCRLKIHKMGTSNMTSDNRETGVNIVVLVNRFLTSSVKCWTANFCTHAFKGPVTNMNQLKSIFNRSFNDSHSHPIHTCFQIVAINYSHCIFSRAVLLFD